MMHQHFDLPVSFLQRITDRLRFLYKDHLTGAFLYRFYGLIEDFRKRPTYDFPHWSQQDVVLITYGDSIREEEKAPLQTLYDFWKAFLKDRITVVHILPFFPYSSDDGFAVQDYMKVNPALGHWEDIKQLGEEVDLMFDLVVNHVSAGHKWFKAFMEGEENEREYFITVSPEADTSTVVRPRSKPLLTPVETPQGTRWVWTTFSADQVDLNFRNPEVLLEIMKVLLFYLRQGARIIRLDAIAFLWKRLGTPSVHLPETHEVVKLMRDVVDLVNPGVILLTETNVPNDENMSYFGEGDEAHMVYQFSLPPLMLHALHTGNGSYLTQWLKTIPSPRPGNTFFNFTASHDGIGVRPLEGLLPEEQKQMLLHDMQTYGGYISTKTNADGSESAYEINITYFDAMRGTQNGFDSYQVERFLCSQTIMLQLKGVPAFYIHSLLGTRNALRLAEESGQHRSINRYKWDYNELKEVLESDHMHHGYILRELKRRIGIRQQHKAFHPDAKQYTLEVSPAIIVMMREWEENDERIVCLANLQNQKGRYAVTHFFKEKGDLDNLLSDEPVNLEHGHIVIEPYQVMWLKKIEDKN
jgi:sucrose phosphorylase